MAAGRLVGRTSRPALQHLSDIENEIGSEIEVSAPATLATARRLPFVIGLATVME
jgi:hypothetical protein